MSVPVAGVGTSADRPRIGRWQMLGLSINDVVGSGIYLMPAAAFALLGGFSLWAVLLAGLTAALLVLCYAQAASYFDRQGGSYLYACEAFGPFVGFQVGWTIWLTRISAAAALSQGLVDAISHFWPQADATPWRAGIVFTSLLLLTAINIAGVRWAANTAVVLVVGKLVPLLAFIFIGLFHVDWGMALSVPQTALPHYGALGSSALLLLFAYAGFENMAVAAGEYRNPKRNIPFVLITMIVFVTLLYTAVQLVAQGTLLALDASKAPLAEAASLFGGWWLATLLTVGAALSILGTNSNTMLLGPRFLHSLAQDGYGPAFLARVHPRLHTPAWAILVQGVVALLLALTGSFVQLALLSMVTRILGYISTSASVLVLRRRHGAQRNALKLPGGITVPVLALALLLPILASVEIRSLLAVALAMLGGSVIYLLRRPTRSGMDE